MRVPSTGLAWLVYTVRAWRGLCTLYLVCMPAPQAKSVSSNGLFCPYKQGRTRIFKQRGHNRLCARSTPPEREVPCSSRVFDALSCYLSIIHLEALWYKTGRMNNEEKKCNNIVDQNLEGRAPFAPAWIMAVDPFFGSGGGGGGGKSKDFFFFFGALRAQGLKTLRAERAANLKIVSVK